MNIERTLLAGTLGGLLHLVGVGRLHVYRYGPELFGFSTATDSFAGFGPINLHVVLGGFLLGALPAVLLAERRLVTPALTIVAFVAAIVLLLPRGLEPDRRAAGPSDLAFYFLLWFVPAFVACVLGGIEELVRHLVARERPADVSSVRE